jgi:DNA-directed RNA polymerase sigma subunit (sigma70/sigma32)
VRRSRGVQPGRQRVGVLFLLRRLGLAAGQEAAHDEPQEARKIDPHMTHSDSLHMCSEKISKLSRVQHQLRQDFGREPGREETATEMGITQRQVHEILGASQEPVSLDDPIGEEEGSQLQDFMVDRHATPLAKKKNASVRSEAIGRVLDLLTDRERRVIELRFGLRGKQTLASRQLGRRLGLSYTRILQIEAESLAKARTQTLERRESKWRS